MIVERKKLLSPCHTIRPACCQPPVNCTVNWVSTDQLLPSEGRSWPRKLTGPSAVVAEFESSSKLFVGMVSTPPPIVGASAPSVGVPPLRVWRSHCEPIVVPSNSSERAGVQPAPERMRN